MESFLTQLSTMFGWLIRSTAQVSILACIILTIKILIRGRLPARWHYWLWLLLLIRIVIPYGPQSNISVFNLMSLSTEKSSSGYVGAEFADDITGVQQRRVGYPSLVEEVEQYIETRETTAEAPAEKSLSWNQIKTAGIKILPPTWFTGVIFLVIYAFAGNFNLWRIVKCERPLTEQRILDLLEDCKEQLGVQTILGVVVTDRVKSPSLFGFIRPRLLLPKGIIESLSTEQLRHVFLHELAHLRRHDIGIGWLMAMCQAIHWFNPLVWYAFYRMRLDRELACDSLVLSYSQPDESPEYGLTIVNLLERFSQRRRLPSLAGVLEDKSQLKRRIKMISQSKENSYRWSNLAIILIILLGCVTLTDAQSQQTEQSDDYYTLTEADLPETSYINENGHIVDKIDYPFEDDPEVIGGWRAVDFVRKVDDFVPGAKSFKGDLFLKELFFLEGGRSNWAFTWTKGLLLHSEDMIAPEYYIEEIDGTTYMFFEWKSGDYTIRHRRPSYYVLEKDDRMVHVVSRTADSIDYPFVDDPDVIGVWRSVDFVEKPEQFNPSQKRWMGGELFLKDMAFINNGRVFCRLNKEEGLITCTDKWTKGLVIDEGQKTASRYILKEIDGSTYMFYEWKSGDYTMRRREPGYYVLKFESTEIGRLAEGWASQPTDEQFRAGFPEKIEQVDIDTATLNQVIETFGEPAQYVRGKDTFTKNNLPRQYTLIYPDRFHIYMRDNQIVELRYYRPSYPIYSVEVGSSLDDVLEAVGQPTETIVGRASEWKPSVLYKDIDGRKGFCYYHRPDKYVRFFFTDYKVNAIYETRSNYGRSR